MSSIDMAKLGVVSIKDGRESRLEEQKMDIDNKKRIRVYVRMIIS